MSRMEDARKKYEGIPVPPELSGRVQAAETDRWNIFSMR